MTRILRKFALRNYGRSAAYRPGICPCRWGQNESYVNQIENGKTLPSLTGLFYICEYFGITPKEFFDEGNADPKRLMELVDIAKKLDSSNLALVSELAKRLADGQR